MFSFGVTCNDKDITGLHQERAYILGAWSSSEGGNKHQSMNILFRDICGIYPLILMYTFCIYWMILGPECQNQWRPTPNQRSWRSELHLFRYFLPTMRTPVWLFPPHAYMYFYCFEVWASSVLTLNAYTRDLWYTALGVLALNAYTAKQ